MRHSHGFSIIELMVAIAIMSVLMAIALPAFSDYIRNVKVRTEAEAFVSGLQLARAEAVRRNVPVQFVLTSDAPIEANVASPTQSTSGPNWIVRTRDTPVFIEGRAAPISGGVPTVRINDTTSPAADDPDAPPGTPLSLVEFNGLGRSALGADTAFKFTNPDLKCQTDGGPIRCLRVTVTVFGQTRLCDPRAATGDPRSC